MGRIFAFGCSFTYGIGLEDCHDRKDQYDPSLRPSKHAWPALLAEATGLTVLNRSVPAASNMEILWEILSTPDFAPGDLAIIMWTLPNRDVYFQKQAQAGYGGRQRPFVQLGSWARGDQARRWILEMDEYDYQQRVWLHMHHAELFLKSRDVSHMHFPAYPVETCVSKPSFIDISNLHLQGVAPFDVALDKEHPGPESQKATTVVLLDLLKLSGFVN